MKLQKMFNASLIGGMMGYIVSGVGLSFPVILIILLISIVIWSIIETILEVYDDVYKNKR